MENKKKMALLIVNHLKTQLSNGSFNDESLESMEVAIQCIESAYNLNPTESDNVDAKLEMIVKEYYQVREQRVNYVLIIMYMRLNQHSQLIESFSCIQFITTILFI